VAHCPAVTPATRVILVPLAAAALLGLPSSPARAATAPPGLPAGVPAAATRAEPVLPGPPSWPFGEQFPRTSGTGRLAGGAQFWSDFLYDDHGAASLSGLQLSNSSNVSGLAPTQGSYGYTDPDAHGNGADIFRSAVGEDTGATYWRVDWNTLTDQRVPLAVWGLDTDGSTATGTAIWPGGAGVTSPGVDRFLVVSGAGARLVDTDLLTPDVVLPTAVDLPSRSFVVRVPKADLPVSGTWRVRLVAGLDDGTGSGFAAPQQQAPVTTPTGAPRVYNVGYRSIADEPPVFTDGVNDAIVAATQAAVAATPLGQSVGLDGLARGVTGNFWMEDHQADVLGSTADISPFSTQVSWTSLAAGDATAEPRPTGYSNRWYVAPQSLGQGVIANPADKGTGDLRPNYLGRVQPYAVYVPAGVGAGAPLTWVLHSLSVNHNQYGALNPQLLQSTCEQRRSICVTTEGFAPDGWYFDEAEADFWQVWREVAEAYAPSTERTVVSGYSMGGWAAYKLGLAHPDLFAKALSLEGPPSCGIRVVDGVRFPSDQDPSSHCAADGESAPVLQNARWLPYQVTQGAIDELVPVPGALQQVKALDDLGYRYRLEFFATEDHLVYATQDRFDTQAAALGTPARTVDPGHVTYAWYPDLDSPALGIGATTAYWLSGLTARSSAPGNVARVDARSLSRPDPAVTVARSGPTLITEPVPGTLFDLTWQLGARPAARAELALTLTGVRTVTVDAVRAGVTCGTTVRSTSDGTTRLTVERLPSGARLMPSGGATGTAAVLPAGASAVRVVCPGAGGGSPATPASGPGTSNGSGTSSGATGHLAATGGLPLAGLGAALLLGAAVLRRRTA
jgi:Prolyl oligopeptidase family